MYFGCSEVVIFSSDFKMEKEGNEPRLLHFQFIFYRLDITTIHKANYYNNLVD